MIRSYGCLMLFVLLICFAPSLLISGALWRNPLLLCEARIGSVIRLIAPTWHLVSELCVML